MNNLKILSICMVIGTMLFLISCEKSEVQDQEEISDSLNTERILEDRVRFATVFSHAIKDQEFYNFIVEECLKSDLNDAEILYAELYDRNIGSSNITVGNFLSSLEISSRSKSESSSGDFFKSKVLRSDPLLGVVLLPGRDKDYLSISEEPRAKTVYIDKIFDEFEKGEHITFVTDGVTSSHVYNEDQEPLDPYFAVKLNEEYIAYDIYSESVYYNQPYTLTTIGAYVRYDDIKSDDARITSIGDIVVANKGFTSDVGGDGPVINRDCDEECDRDCKDGKDAITRVKFNHDYEGWPRGGPEFIMQYAFGFNSTANPTSASPYGYTLANSARNSYNFGGGEDTWYTKNRDNTTLSKIQLLEWDLSYHSLDMQQLWTEDDGNAREFTVGGSFKVKVDIPLIGESEVGVSLGTKTLIGGDDEIATIIVQFCDNWGYEYVIAGPSGDLFMAQLDRDY